MSVQHFYRLKPKKSTLVTVRFSKRVFLRYFLIADSCGTKLEKGERGKFSIHRKGHEEIKLKAESISEAEEWMRQISEVVLATISYSQRIQLMGSFHRSRTLNTRPKISWKLNSTCNPPERFLRYSGSIMVEA